MPTADPLDPFLPTLERLADRWISAGQLLPGFALLAQGRPVSVEALAREAGTETAQVERAVDAARCGRDAHGRLIDLYGLTLSATRHRLMVGDKILFSCCALWAHVVPKLVGRSIQIESVDPVESELVRLEVSPAGIESVGPPGAVATIAVATRKAIERDVSEAWCQQVAHFVSRESAEEFAATRASCQVIGLSTFHRAAERFHRAVWRAMEA